MNNSKHKPSFVRSFSTLFSGLAIVQVINLLYSLLLPRFFSPEAFAEFGIFTAIVFILAEIVNAKLDIALMLGSDESSVKDILDAAFTVATLVTIVLFAIGFIVISFIPVVYLLLPFVIFLYGMHQPIIVYLNKQGSYSNINFFRLIQVISTAIITLVFGLLNLKHALISGFCIGILIATLYALTQIRPSFSWKTTKEIWNKFDQFPKYGTWSSLLNNFSRNSVPLVLTAFFTPHWVGFYTYATRLLNAPTGMFSTALGQVYFKNAGELNDLELKPITQKVIKTTFFLAIFPTLIVLFFGKELFQFLFSAAWIESGIVAQYLVLWYFLGVIVSPISILLDLKNRLKFEFWFNFILAFMRLLALYIGGVLQNFYISILLYAAVGILMNLILLYYINYSILNNGTRRAGI